MRATPPPPAYLVAGEWNISVPSATTEIGTPFGPVTAGGSRRFPLASRGTLTRFIVRVNAAITLVAAETAAFRIQLDGVDTALQVELSAANVTGDILTDNDSVQVAAQQGINLALDHTAGVSRRPVLGYSFEFRPA